MRNITPCRVDAGTESKSNGTFRRIDMFYISLIGLIAFKLIYNAGNFLELYFYDESVSLFIGRDFQLSQLFVDGSVYFAWYKILSLFIHDPLRLYAANYAILIAINGFLLYIFQRKLSRSPFFSAAAAIFFMLSSANIYTWPFITRFAIALILLTLIFCFSVSNNIHRYIIGLGGLFVLIWVRPEFMLSLTLYLFAGLCVIFHHLWRRREFTALHTAAVILSLLLAFFVFFVKNPADTGRSVWAFGQHYANQLHKSGEIKHAPEGHVDWRSVMKDRFGGYQSIWRAALNNPGEMMKYILSNVKQIPEKTLYGHFPFTQLNYSPPLKFVIKWLLIGLYFFSLFHFLRMLCVKYKVNCPHYGEPERLDERERFFRFLLLVLAAPVIFSVIVIFPRDHYILVFIAILYIGMLFYLPGRKPRIPGFRCQSVLGVLLVFLVFYIVPWRDSASAGIWPGAPLSGCTNIKRLQMLRDHTPLNRRLIHVALSRAKNWNLVQSPKQYLEADSQARYTFIAPGGSAFSQWLETNRIDMILVDEHFLAEPQWRTDKDFQHFMKNPAESGWREKYASNCAEYVLVKQ